MRRFAKLTRNGKSVYVDPSLVGVIRPSASDPAITQLMGREQVSNAVDDRYVRPIAACDESPDEAYRRLAAAGETVTRAEFEAVGEELRMACWTSGSDLRVRMMTAVNADEVRSVLIAPIQAIYDKLKKTTLAALWVAEGEEPPK